VTGAGGIGKSRLAWELEKYVDGISERIRWHRGRSPSYGEGITFWALGEMVRRRCGLLEDADEATTRDRVHSTVAQFVTADEDRRWVEPALLTLLDAPVADANWKALGGMQQPLEELLALEQRGLAEIVSIAIKQIENVVHDRRLGDLVFAWSSNMHAFLQAFEVAMAPRIKRDNLSIEDCVRSCDRIRK